MPARSPNTIRVAKRVRLRSLLGAALRHGGRGLVAGAILGFMLVMASRLGWLPLGWPTALGACCVVGALIGLAPAFSADWTLLGAAQRADRASGLKDRLSTALSLGRLEREPSPAERVAIADGEGAAAALPARSVVPIRLGAAWAAWPIVLGGAVAIGIWVPQRSYATDQPGRPHASEPERRAAADAIAETARQARGAAEGALRDVASAEDLALLEAIERELIDGNREPDEALAEGARGLESLAARAEQQAAKTELADETLRGQMQQTLPEQQDASELYEALARGDLDAARDAAEALTRQGRELAPEERARIAEEMARLADYLEQAAEADAEAPESPTADALREQGVQDPAGLGEETQPDRLQQALEERGVAPEAAEPLADRLAQENLARQAEEQAREDLRTLSEAARDAAEEMRKPELPPQPEAGAPDERDPQPAAQTQGQPAEPPTTKRTEGADKPPQNRGEDERRPEGERQGRQREEKPGQPQGQKQEEKSGQQQGQKQEEKPGQQQGQKQEEKPGQQEGQQQGEKPGQQQGQKQGEKPGQQPGQKQEERPGQQQGQKQGEKPGQQQGQQQGEKPGQQQGQQQGEKPGQQQGEQQGEKPGQQQGEQRPGQSPGEQAREADQGPAQGVDREGDSGAMRQQRDGDQGESDGVDSLRRELQRLTERGQQGRSEREASEALREQAERLLERASPEHRRELERLAREIERETPNPAQGLRPGEPEPWRTEPFDARAEPPEGARDPGHVIADWFDPAGAPRPSEGDAGTSSPAPFSDAARGAERAIERQIVPRSRSELVRRVFERYRRRAGESGQAPRASDPAGS